ncbi:MAG: Ig-like domain-containing protein [Proteobacteria bacterium]|nr:Ig-like domain-containing protein [Pseudomonadota bacterium]
MKSIYLPFLTGFTHLGKVLRKDRSQPGTSHLFKKFIIGLCSCLFLTNFAFAESLTLEDFENFLPGENPYIFEDSLAPIPIHAWLETLIDESSQDYEITLTLQPFSGRGGVAFRYQDPDNHYRLFLDKGISKIQKCVNGECTSLAEEEGYGVEADKYLLRLRVEGNSFRIYRKVMPYDAVDPELFPETLWYEITDSTFTNGKVAFYSHSGTFYMDDVLIKDLEDTILLEDDCSSLDNFIALNGQWKVSIPTPGDLNKIVINPGADTVIYLDIDGEKHGGILHAYRFRDPQTVRDFVYSFSRLFTPFNVTITSDPEVFVDYQQKDRGWGMHIAIGAGGIAGSFGKDIPYRSAVDHGDSRTAIHEMGHSLGLGHMASTLENDEPCCADQYYDGHEVVAGDGIYLWQTPMGTGSTSNPSHIVQWTKGEYYGSAVYNTVINGNYIHDPLVELSYRLSYRFDDHVTTDPMLAERLIDGQTIEGLIERNTDVDIFKIEPTEGVVDISVVANPHDPPNTLDVGAVVYDSSGNPIAESMPHETRGLGAELSFDAGENEIYYLHVTGEGRGDPLGNPPNGYTSYGSLGEYSVTATYSEVEYPATITHGVAYYYFEGEWASIPDFDQLTPEESGSVSGLELPTTCTSSQCAVQLKALVDIPSTNYYRFEVESNGIGEILLGGKILMSFDHSSGENKTDYFRLDGGLHLIEVKYVAQEGENHLRIYHHSDENRRDYPRSAFAPSILYLPQLNQVAPVAQDNHYPVITDRYLVGTLENAQLITRNDYDLNGDKLDLVSYTYPSNGQLSVDLEDGSFVYKPNPGFIGTDSFSYRISDGQASDEAIVYFQVDLEENLDIKYDPQAWVVERVAHDRFKVKSKTNQRYWSSAPENNGGLYTKVDPPLAEWIVHPVNGSLPTGSDLSGCYIFEVPEGGYQGRYIYIDEGESRATVSGISATLCLDLHEISNTYRINKAGDEYLVFQEDVVYPSNENMDVFSRPSIFIEVPSHTLLPEGFVFPQPEDLSGSYVFQVPADKPFAGRTIYAGGNPDNGLGLGDTYNYLADGGIDDTRIWTLAAVPNEPETYTIQSHRHGLFMDGDDSDEFEAPYDDRYEDTIVSRPAQYDDSQKWIVKKLANGHFTIQEKTNLHFLSNDFYIQKTVADGSGNVEWIATPQPENSN